PPRWPGRCCVPVPPSRWPGRASRCPPAAAGSTSDASSPPSPSTIPPRPSSPCRRRRPSRRHGRVSARSASTWAGEGMNPRLALRIAAYLLVADAVGALLLANLLGPLGLLLIATALAVSWWRTGSGRTMTRLDRLLVLLAAGAATIHLVYMA